MDDGTSETSLGTSAADIVWLNRFTSTPGMERIVALDIMFGHPGTADGPPDGSPITVGVWSDPNNDGDPADALLLTSDPGTIQNSHTNTFVSFSLNFPVTIPSGSNFFAGFRSDTALGGGANYAIAGDDSSSAGVSFIYGNTTPGALDNDNLVATDVFGVGNVENAGFLQNHMIRATGVAIPEPSAALLLVTAFSIALFVRTRN